MIRSGTGENADSAISYSPDTQQGPASTLVPLHDLLPGQENLAVLPLRRNADNYLHCFWEFVHPLFPVLHKGSLVARYEQLWMPHDTSKADTEDVTFMPILNLVFAVGCQFSDLLPAAQKASAAHSFYQKSRSVLQFDVLGSSSVSVVQWLLLSGVYLQSTSLASNCWNSVGLAIRLAQGLGLHVEYSDQRAETQRNREMRRRVWHTCVVLDR